MRRGERTALLQLFQQFIMLPPQLRPLRKLVLAAGRVHLRAHLQELALQLPLLGGRLRRREVDVEIP